ncbi:cbb3-type cytochrome c oxidase subunit I [Sphaerobacter sp.]|uniref:cbb3-type cytochrome c oxidase subunit I n=1 Tax=Sphaerobacter sp. TaxID=2099654 RepID=UPI001D57C011|nr:cbb3-type cytochrome c oxidase subunit I [Sphaerobacter sp.]MBX5446023.1 cbb3-type cytochrome c oxidase subunit I [Sphaerobacter sp.]
MTGAAISFQREAVAEEAVTAYPAEQLRPIRWQLLLGFIGLLIGGYMGLLQALERVGVDFYKISQIKTYYQGLTLHGVLLALVFTFTFANAFTQYMTIRAYGRPLASTALVHASFLTAALGVVLAGYAILTNQATVLFTFYAPLKAHPLFYLGAVFLVISTWIVLANLLLTLRAWRRDHPGERIPLMAYMGLFNYLMWTIATVGIAIEVLAFLLPWSLGWVGTTDPQLNRILFWLTGHPIVYFWLLPAYMSWYALIPGQVGGKLYSDGLTRLTFLLFLLFSIPVGLHHQFTDPGIPPAMKAIHAVLTFVVFVPSMITAFSVMAALEMGGRKAGGKGVLGWIPRLPWREPSVAAQLLAMLTFFLGGATGLINASYTMNLTVHNTAFVPGHFHLTVGTAVALTFMGISYWFVPYLTGRQLFSRRLALAQAWFWAIGALIFARGQIQGGLDAMPRRTAIGSATYSLPGWDVSNWFTAVGGVLMAIGGVLFFIVLIGTLFNPKRIDPATVEPVLSQPIHGPKETWKAFDRVGLWVVVSIALLLIAYLPVIIPYLPANMTSPPVKAW